MLKKKLFIRGLATTVILMSMTAVSKTKEVYKTNGNNDNSDAFRHTILY